MVQCRVMGWEPLLARQWEHTWILGLDGMGQV